MEDPDIVAYANAQPVPMTAVDVLGQNLQALTQIVNSQQQMFDRQQEWLRRSQVSFKMPKMMKDDDPEAYIEAFEHHALMTGLPQDYWASHLGALVVGAAQAAYRDYEQVKQAILYRLEISPDHYRCLFRARKGPDERRPQVLLQLLRDLLDKWVNPVGSDRDDLADQVILEQFQNDLEERTQRWVRQHSPRNWEEALKLAEAFAVAEASYLRERRSPGPASVLLKEAEQQRAPIWGAGRDTTDASEMAVGAVLTQEEEGIERPIAYASLKLSSAERRYATIERECLAIRWAMDHFWYYLMGQEFKLVMDHAPLLWLSTARTDNDRIT
ncbi:hypothetical protein Y1Q_0013504 [Alligator mississippiensis]|uniref:SCAN box domain-containing protein n=1 Tax=Alligator mississippiensis TaxID=8496 RepID=A0A151P3E0_ALLMI|nr:hypothetical protein Y1Q_0013504 [Alligator mississippiensis]